MVIEIKTDKPYEVIVEDGVLDRAVNFVISTDKIPRHGEIFCHSHHAEILNFPRICGKINRLF